MKNENTRTIVLALGAIFGALTGVLTSNLALWLSIGVALGAAGSYSTGCTKKGSQNLQNFKRIAFIGGIGYLVIFISGIYANFVVLEGLKVPDNMLLTFQNIANNRQTFMTGVLSFVIMVLADLMLTWCLYVLFHPLHKSLSKITAVFRLVNVIFFGAALFYLVHILQLTDTEHLILHSEEFLINEVDSALTSFNNTWLVGLLFFGVHLILLAVMMFKYVKIPTFIPILLMVAGIGYLTDSILQFGYANYQSIAEVSTVIVVLPGVVGELSLTFWLLFYKGQNQNSKN